MLKTGYLRNVVQVSLGDKRSDFSLRRVVFKLNEMTTKIYLEAVALIKHYLLHSLSMLADRRILFSVL